MLTVDDMVGGVAGWAAAVVAGYLAVGFAAAIVAQRRAAIGRRAERLLLLYPRFVRTTLRALAVAALGIGAGAPATAAHRVRTPHGARPRPPVVAPLPRPRRRGRSTGRSLPTSPVAALRPAQPDHADPGPFVTVRTGECLWSLAAQGDRAGMRCAAQIAAAWPLLGGRPTGNLIGE